jgi:hypothetical protein
MADQERRNYLLLIKCGGDTPVRNRVAESIPLLKEILEQVSGKDLQFTTSSDDAGTMAFLFASTLPAGAILARLKSPGRPGATFPVGSPLAREDSVLVAEIGDDFAAENLGRALVWMQRH